MVVSNGKIWVSQLDGTWKSTGMPYVSSGSGYVPGKFVWRHNGTDWVQVWVRDTTPPPAPTVTLALVLGKANAVNVTVRNGATGADPIRRTVVKVSWDGVQPSNPGTVDKYYLAQTTTGGAGIPEEWSEFWKGYPDAGDNVGTKTVPASYQTFTIPVGSTVKVSAWAQDSYYNWSSGSSASLKTPQPDPPPLVMREVSTTVACVNAGEWSSTSKQWTSTGDANGYTAAAGPYDIDGYWFYGSGLYTPIKAMSEGKEMRVYIKRHAGAYGTSGQAEVEPKAHNYPSKPSGTPSITATSNALKQGLSRGEGKWFPLPVSWMDNFATGGLHGIAIGNVGVTSTTDPRYVICYGRGTTSGNVYMRWTQF